MFNIERTGPNRIDIEIGGKIDSDEMREALTALFPDVRVGISL